MNLPTPLISVIIPALNEAGGIARVLDALPETITRIIVADNGSTDATAAIARDHGAIVVTEPQRGYGAACLAALDHLADLPRPESPTELEIVVFLDADFSDDPSEIDALIAPIRNDQADLVIGSRVLGRCDPGALTLPQRFGNRLASTLLRTIWQIPCTDLGPFRAIRYTSLQQLQLDDQNYGWTVQMQARAARYDLRIHEVPVSYRKRIGHSKISGTIRGVIGAGTKILYTIAHEYYLDQKGG